MNLSEHRVARVPPPLCEEESQGGAGGIPPCFWQTVQSKKILGKNLCEILTSHISKDKILIIQHQMGEIIDAYLIMDCIC